MGVIRTTYGARRGVCKLGERALLRISGYRLKDNIKIDFQKRIENLDCVEAGLEY
jgi:hypothetical protein